MADFFSYDLVEALRMPGCPICRSVVEREDHDMTVFVREGRRVPEARIRLVESGGFCRRHALLFHDVCLRTGAEYVIVDVYRQVVENDINLLARRQPTQHALVRRRRCPACDVAAENLGRKAAFFVDALRDYDVRAAYAYSDGLCAAHLDAVLEVAFDEEPPIARFLADDWRTRLRLLARDLEEVDRKRDYRYADEPKGPEQRSPLEVLRRYAGDLHDQSDS
jgi:hypothetical protein